MPPKKNRTPSKCRDWERERRNRFNEVFSRLGVIVLERPLKNAPDASTEQPPNLSKVEILQRAIIVIQDLRQENTILNTKLLSPNAQNDTNKAENSTERSKKSRNFPNTKCQKRLENEKGSNKENKKMKKRERLKMLIKLKARKQLSESITRKQKTLKKKQQKNLDRFPKILPKTTILQFGMIENKLHRPDKTVMILPDGQLLLPQRHIVSSTPQPAPTPTLLLIPSFLAQPMNPSFPIPPRSTHTHNDNTRTTMVNKLPIAAYSFPLSVARNRGRDTSNVFNDKSAPRVVENTHRRFMRVLRQKTSAKEVFNTLTPKKNQKSTGKNMIEVSQSDSRLENTILNVNNQAEKTEPLLKVSLEQHQTFDKTGIIDKENIKVDVTKKNCLEVSQSANFVEKTNRTDLKFTSTPQNQSRIQSVNEHLKSVEIIAETAAHVLNKNRKCENKSSELTQCEIDSLEKSKLTKHSPSLLDHNVCDNIADGGNARLELAEEFLAASPTAAFLLAFPLVSGARPDSPEEPVTTSSTTTPCNAPQIPPVPNNNSLKPFVCSSTDSSSKEIKAEKHGEIIPVISRNLRDKTSIVGNKNNYYSLNNIFSDTNLSTLPDYAFSHSHSILAPPLAESIFNVDHESHLKNNSQNIESNIKGKNDMLPNSKTSNINYYSNVTSCSEPSSASLLPCAVDKYANRSHKAEFTNLDDSFMKIGTSRFGYDFDIALPQKSFEFVNPTSNTVGKDVMYPSTSVSYSNTNNYNPFTSDVPVPYISSTSNGSSQKKTTTKGVTSFYSDLTSFYPQTSSLWSEDFANYQGTTTGLVKANTPFKHSIPQLHNNSVTDKANNCKTYESNKAFSNKHPVLDISHLVSDKIDKKSPTKAPVNWMTSEVRSLQNNCDLFSSDTKEVKHRYTVPAINTYCKGHHDTNKKHEELDSALFPITMPNYTTQLAPEEFHQPWPTSRPIHMPTEPCVDAPALNLPTLVGDLALGPHERRQSSDRSARSHVQADLPHAIGNLFSVSQLVERSVDNRVNLKTSNDCHKAIFSKPDNSSVYTNPAERMADNIELNLQSCYYLNNARNTATHAENVCNNSTYPKYKQKNTKLNKSNYTAEALMRGVNPIPKCNDSMPILKLANTQKPFQEANNVLNEQFGQIPHFPPIIDYGDTNYTQQYTGNNLYNVTSTTMTPFYTGYMSTNAPIIPPNYASTGYANEFIDIPPTSDSTFGYTRYDNYKIRNSLETMCDDKLVMDVSKQHSSSKEVTKHKLDNSVKKKPQSKRIKTCAESDAWNMGADMLWSTKVGSKKNPTLLSEDAYATYQSNPVQPYNMSDIFIPHSLAPIAPVSSNVTRTNNYSSNTSRTNFNLSTIFPEIAKMSSYNPVC